MALDDTTDAQLTALAALVATGVNADLAAITTEPAIVRCYPWPITIARAPALQLPALAVYRLSETTVRRTMGRRETETTFRFDYWAAVTPLDRIELRWPLLRAVWRSLEAIVQAGEHAAVDASASVLDAAGFVSVVRSSPTVRYITPGADETAIPRFEGSIVLRHREDFDLAGLSPFLALHGAIARDATTMVSLIADADDA